MISITIRSALFAAATLLTSALLTLAPASAGQYTVKSGDTKTDAGFTPLGQLFC
ncbi:hypothetical protein [Deinococcus sp.]|uniref:hypothetical protein n=1 Tax=Deinococcus sp. TaxID=47478 RepID=UPI003C7AE43B